MSLQERLREYALATGLGSQLHHDLLAAANRLDQLEQMVDAGQRLRQIVLEPYEQGREAGRAETMAALKQILGRVPE